MVGSPNAVSLLELYDASIQIGLILNGRVETISVQKPWVILLSATHFSES